MWKWSFVLLGCVACGGGGSEAPDAAQPDAVQPDAAPPDAVPIDAAPSVLGQYVVDHVDVPIDSTESDALGSDLDGDGTIDNQLGNILSALVQAGGSGAFDPQADTDAAVAAGDLILLLASVPCDGDGCAATFAGVDLGGGNYGIAPGSPTDGRVQGATVGDVYSGGPGALVYELTIMGSAPVLVDLQKARAHLVIDGTTLAAGSTIAGGIPDSEVQGRIVPSVYTGISALIAHDCGVPGGTGDCMCVDGSIGQTYLGIFDDNLDCTVPLDEFQNNSLVTTLFRPDLDTDGDDLPDALSVGVGVKAVAASFDLPAP